MSKKVFFYMILDLIGIGITLIARGFVLGTINKVTISWLQIGLTIVLNIAAISVCLFIVLFFILYWWSDRKWSDIKSKFKRRG